jgi:hypothetical protein
LWGYMWGRKRAPKNSQQYQLFTEKMAERGSAKRQFAGVRGVSY